MLKSKKDRSTLRGAAHAAFVLSVWTFCGIAAWSQQPTKTPTPRAEEDVIRVNTDLVQTFVRVFDQQGHFVDNLGRDQFEIRVDGAAVPILFFDRLDAGSTDEAKKLAAARNKRPNVGNGPAQPIDRLPGRTVIFFIDDLHLSLDGMARTKTALSKFINESMREGDSIAVLTATGQLGYLEQPIDNKSIALRVVDRLSASASRAGDGERPPMSTSQALAIERGDDRILQHFINVAMSELFPSVTRTNPGQARKQAEIVVRNRARRIVQLHSSVALRTVRSLENVLRGAGQMPGSKLMFFISDGFELSEQDSADSRSMRKLADTANAAGVTVYSWQAGGLATNTFPDAASNDSLDRNYERGESPMGEEQAVRTPLFALAKDTGGDALFNTNSPDSRFKQAVAETAQYYVLAWQPENSEAWARSSHRVSVTVKGHSDWNVRLQSDIGGEGSKPAGKKASDNNKEKQNDSTDAPAVALRAALAAPFPPSDVRISIDPGFVDTPNAGLTLSVLAQAAIDPDSFDVDAERQLEFAGIVIDNDGKLVSSFDDRVKVQANKGRPSSDAAVVMSASVRLNPGLYQVRVAVLDPKTQLSGSTSKWVELPDLRTSRLALSSVFVGEHSAGATSNPDNKARLSIDHVFSRSSRLRLLVYIYNGFPVGRPDGSYIELQTMIGQGGREIISAPAAKVTSAGSADRARVPYAAEISLAALQPGHYTLTITAVDPRTKARASQSTIFSVR